MHIQQLEKVKSSQPTDKLHVPQKAVENCKIMTSADGNHFVAGETQVPATGTKNFHIQREEAAKNSKTSTHDMQKGGTIAASDGGHFVNGQISTIENGFSCSQIVTAPRIPDVQTKTYLRRFWILGLFATIAFVQCIIWGTWGPILDSAQTAFPSWSPGIIALFPAWGTIDVIIFIVPLSWFNQKYGLRKGILLATFLMAFGTSIRCITSNELAFTILAHAGSIINGLAGCLTLSLPAMVAAIWFPPKERTTATAVGALTSQLGGAAMYLEPLVVRTETDGVTPDEIRQEIMTLMYIHAGVAVFLFLCVVICFPAKPPLPPSNSSAMERLEYFPSFRKMIRNKQMMLVCVTYSFSFGIPVVWVGVMNFSLNCIGFRQDESMWVAIVSVTGSSVAAIIAGRLTDYVYGHLRNTIIVLLLLSSVFFFWFLLLSFEAIPPSRVQVFIAVTGGVSLEFATVPLLVELAVEMAYPCPESVVGAFLTGLFNVVSCIFLLLFLIPTQCYQWVNIVLVCCTSLTVLPLLFIKEEHNRSSNDRK